MPLFMHDMAAIDVMVLLLYFSAIVAVGVWAGRDERTTDDYFLGGRRQPWLIVGLSILATELSAITFIGVPADAFHGDCSYLQLYVGSFLGRMAVVWLLLPVFYRARVTTVYEYLGLRFGPWTRATAVLFFFASRIIGSGLRLLAASIAVSVVFDWPLIWVIVGCAAVAVGYTTIGGIKAVIWTDALQAVVFLGSAAAVLIFLMVNVPGSIGQHLSQLSEAGKLHVFNWSADLNNPKAFYVLLVYALFLNAAAFGADQDLTHRMLTCSDVRGGQKSLTFNAIIGLPVVMLFLGVGVMLWSYYQAFPETAPTGDVKIDHVFPFFIRHALPAGWGLQGLVLAGVFAAAMSSLDSALGALSASAVVDVYRPFIAPNRKPAHYVRAGRAFVLLFGVALTAMAIVFITQDQILWEAFKWASLVFGSLLGVFLLAVCTRRRGHDQANACAMFLALAVLAVFKRYDDPVQPLVAWPWWIVIGTGITFGIGVLFRSPDRVANTPAT